MIEQFIAAEPHRMRRHRAVGQCWQAICWCGWASPVVPDQRTAAQAHAEHARETTR